MRVLVVEDDEATRLFIASAIRGRGHETRSAGDGALGLAAFEEFRPDIVFTDIKMPEMDGIEMLQKIREIVPEALVVIISTLDSPEYTLRALQLKANDYLVKPIFEKRMHLLLDKYVNILADRAKVRATPAEASLRELEMEIPNHINEIGMTIARLMLETKPVPVNDMLGIHLGLVEILTNSIEHGNLEIGFREKSKAISRGDDGWLKLVEERASLPPYRDRKVKIRFTMGEDRCEWLVTDEGPGFDWTKIPDQKDARNLLNETHGRGIMLARLQFDEIEYLGCGNSVRLVKYLSGNKNNN